MSFQTSSGQSWISPMCAPLVSCAELRPRYGLQAIQHVREQPDLCVHEIGIELADVAIRRAGKKVARRRKKPESRYARARERPALAEEVCERPRMNDCAAGVPAAASGLDCHVGKRHVAREPETELRFSRGRVVATRPVGPFSGAQML